MTSRKKEKLINLIPQDKFASSSLGRVLTWLLTTFRIIVIVVEMVVMLAFLSRFWLDSKNSDLDDLIEQKEAQISTASALEQEFIYTQKRLKIFSSLASEEKATVPIINVISSHLPPDVFLKSLQITPQDKSIKLIGFSPSDQGIAQFIVNLETEKNFAEVTLMQADTEEKNQGLINFTLMINQAKQGG